MDMPVEKGGEGYLEGQLLLAMPTMDDPRFERAVVYLCAHSPEGAMGLIINREADNIDFPQLLEQLDVDVPEAREDIIVHAGGPVEPTRGFVLHSADFAQDSTLIVSQTVALTATVDVLRALATGEGPRHGLVALGYAGWGPGQLEAELSANIWLSAEADDDLLFDTDLHLKWPLGMAKLGIDISMLSGDAGHA